MNWLYEGMGDVFRVINPWTRSRQIYVHGKRGWRQLLAGLSPQTRMLLLTSFFWNLPLAMTEPYKSLYLTKLGLDAFHLGGVNGLMMGLKAAGVILGGWLGIRFGHKRTLIWGDFLSWVVSTAVLALVTKPIHVVIWACLMATNAAVAASYQNLVLKGTPAESRTGAYGFMNFAGVLPMLFLPFITSLLLNRYDFVLTMRILFGIETLSIATGILLRRRRLPDEASEAMPEASQLAERLVGIAKSVAAAPGSLVIIAFWTLSNIAGNLWAVYFSLYAVDKLAWPAADLGYYSQISSAAFVLASLYWIPRFRAQAARQKLNLFLVNLGGLLPALLLFAGPGWRNVVALNISTGLIAALNGALTGAMLASVLPESELALAFSLCFALMQLLLGAAFPMAGALFKDNMGSFAWSALALNLGQAALAFSLWRQNRPGPSALTA
jgi:MFS family permease